MQEIITCKKYNGITSVTNEVVSLEFRAKKQCKQCISARDCAVISRYNM